MQLVDGPGSAAAPVEQDAPARARMTTRSATASPPPKLCVVRTTVPPAALKASRNSTSHFCPWRSRPVKGSSRSSSGSRPRVTRARPSRRFIPAENVRARSSATASSSTACRRSRRRAGEASRPPITAQKRRFSRAVRSSYTKEPCATIPTCARTASGSRSASTPPTRRRPAPGRTSPARMRSRVVLPAPFGPSRARHWPAGSASETSSSTSVAPYALRIPAASITSEKKKGDGRTVSLRGDVALSGWEPWREAARYAPRPRDASRRGSAACRRSAD